MIAPVMSVDHLGPSFDYATMRDPTGQRLKVNREDPHIHSQFRDDQLGTVYGKTFTWEIYENKNITMGNEIPYNITVLSLAGFSGEQMGREEMTVFQHIYIMETSNLKESQSSICE